MTGAYLRVQRQGKWESIEIEYLTSKEREKILKLEDNDTLLRWLDLVCKTLKKLS